MTETEKNLLILSQDIEKNGRPAVKGDIWPEYQEKPWEELSTIERTAYRSGFKAGYKKGRETPL